jgi:hypothetical protein
MITQHTRLVTAFGVALRTHRRSARRAHALDRGGRFPDRSVQVAGSRIQAPRILLRCARSAANPSPVRAERRTLRARARAKTAACSSFLALLPVRAERRTPRAPARAKPLSRPLLSGARGAPHASRPGARQASQPRARKYVELTDFGTIRSRSANKELTHESWRNQADGRLNRTRQTRDASAVCKHSNLDAEGSDAARHAT